MKNKFIEQKYRVDLDDQFECDEWGKWSRFYSSKKNIEALGLEYREDRAVKLLIDSNLEKIRKLGILSTYFHYRGLTPRVYDYGFLRNHFFLYVEPIIKTEESQIDIIKEKIKEMASKVDWITKAYSVDLDVEKNYINDKYLDFHGFHIDIDKFYAWMSKFISQKTHWGNLKGDKKFAYQDFDRIIGKRRIEERAEEMKLNEINFNGKTVLDIGCNLGLMTNYALNRGAKRAVGIDLKKVIEAADYYKFYRLLRTELYYETLTSNNLTKFGKFDTVL